MKLAFHLSKWTWMINLGIFVFTLIFGALVLTGNSTEPGVAFFLGLIAGFFMLIITGVSHLISAIVAYANYPRLSSFSRQLLHIYAGLVGAFFITWLSVGQIDIEFDEDVFVAILAAVPMILGGFWVYIMKTCLVLNNEVEEKNELIDG